MLRAFGAKAGTPARRERTPSRIDPGGRGRSPTSRWRRCSRYAIACVRARVDDEPLPARRPPCFFDPRHGLSTEDVEYSPPGGAPRDVPACALDAERVKSGAEPDIRKVMDGPQRVPYWEGGAAYAPYAAGYFSAFSIMPAMFMGTMMGSMMFGGFDGGFGDMGGDVGDAGGDAGGDGGGFDFGGFDF